MELESGRVWLSLRSLQSLQVFSIFLKWTPFTFWGLYLQDCQYLEPLQGHPEINLPNNLLAFILSRFIIPNAPRMQIAWGLFTNTAHCLSRMRPEHRCGFDLQGMGSKQPRKTASKNEFAKNALHGCLKVGEIQFKDIHETKQAVNFVSTCSSWNSVVFWLFEFSELCKNSMGEVWQHLARAESSHPVFTLLIAW